MIDLYKLFIISYSRTYSKTMTLLNRFYISDLEDSNIFFPLRMDSIDLAKIRLSKNKNN